MVHWPYTTPRALLLKYATPPRAFLLNYISFDHGLYYDHNTAADIWVSNVGKRTRIHTNYCYLNLAEGSRDTPREP